MIELNTSSMVENLQSTFNENQKFSRKSYLEQFEYFDGNRTEKSERGVPCVLKATRSNFIVNTGKWRADIATDEYLASAASSTEYFLKYYANKNDGEQYSVVHEWFDSTLEQLLEKRGKKLPEDMAISVYYQVVVGIGHMEELGVIHRDINPMNIALIMEKEEIKAKIFNYLLSLVDMVGRDAVGSDPEYMAPSMIQISEGKKENIEYGSCVDYWSATVMLYMMLFGKAPFNIKDAEHSRFGNLTKFSGEKLKIPAKHSVSEGTISLLKRILDPEKSSTLDRDTILEDPIFSRFGGSHNNPLTQSVINQVENSSIMFNSLRMSRIPDMSHVSEILDEVDFCNRVNKLINNRKQRVLFINKGLELASKLLEAFKGEEDKEQYRRALLTTIGLIISMRGRLYSCRHNLLHAQGNQGHSVAIKQRLSAVM